jgi:hypothetical protein
MQRHYNNSLTYKMIHSEEVRISNYKSCNNIPIETKLPKTVYSGALSRDLPAPFASFPSVYDLS